MTKQKMSLRKRLGQEVAHQMYRAIEREHPLRQLFWECTLRCNVHCRHCGSDCKKVAGVPDMPAADFLRVLDSVEKKCDPHEVFVIVTGGEPLVREDLEEVCSEIYRRGFPWGLVTNGLALTEERFAALRKAGMHTLALSLDGLEENHNW
ncbi:MAG: radical SAM protein, partial [Bacteroidales bacterium]|nr:radical SAM protein [Bacteroidales bacterium]